MSTISPFKVTLPFDSSLLRPFEDVYSDNYTSSYVVRFSEPPWNEVHKYSDVMLDLRNAIKHKNGELFCLEYQLSSPLCFALTYPIIYRPELCDVLLSVIPDITVAQVIYVAELFTRSIAEENRGYGKKVIREICQEYRFRGYEYVSLITHANNSKLRSFYEKLGFTCHEAPFKVDENSAERHLFTYKIKSDES